MNSKKEGFPPSGGNFPPSAGNETYPPFSNFPLRISKLPLIFEVPKLEPNFNSPVKNLNIKPNKRSVLTEFSWQVYWSWWPAASSDILKSFTSSSSTQVENTQKTRIHFLCVRNSRIWSNIIVIWCKDRIQVFRNDSFQAPKVESDFILFDTDKKRQIDFNNFLKLPLSFNKQLSIVSQIVFHHWILEVIWDIAWNLSPSPHRVIASFFHQTFSVVVTTTSLWKLSFTNTSIAGRKHTAKHMDASMERHSAEPTIITPSDFIPDRTPAFTEAACDIISKHDPSNNRRKFLLPPAAGLWRKKKLPHIFRNERRCRINITS